MNTNTVRTTVQEMIKNNKSKQKINKLIQLHNIELICSGARSMTEEKFGPGYEKLLIKVK